MILKKCSMKKVTYLGCYADRNNNPEKRVVDAAASTKMDYICDALVAAGYDVDIVSTAFVQKSKHLLKFYASNIVNVRKGIRCRFAPAVCYSSRVSGIVVKLWLCFFFLWNIRKGDQVLVYHSLWYANIVKNFKSLLRFELILEVEEVYTIAFKLSKDKLKEEQNIITCADKYIFSNDLMASLLDIDRRKPFGVVYGQYAYCYRRVDKFFNDGKTHIVYAGSIDRLRYAAHYAVSAAAFLPEKYAMHILGFGPDDVINEVKHLIAESNSKSVCKIFFEGAKQGEEYMRFLFSCDIGLNTQTAAGDYMSYAFPSKLLVYLGHGLNVVTSKLETLPISKIDPVLNYYEENGGEVIANAITRATIHSKQKIEELLISLNTEFVLTLHQMLD